MRLTVGHFRQARFLTPLDHSANAQTIVNELKAGSYDFIELYNF